MLLCALWLEAADTSPLLSLGVGGAIAALVIAMWRQDRKESQDRYALLAKDSIERAAALAVEFRHIVQDNTKALTVLSESVASDKAGVDFRSIVQENTKAISALSEKLDSIPDRCTVAEMLVDVIKSGKPINLEP